MPLAPGTKLGPYEVLAPLGAGGMGEVYRAKDTRLDREIAIKVLPEQFATDPAALARFEREAKAVAALSHPNILAIHDVGTEEGTSFVVTELLEGETLRDRLRRDGFSWRKAVETAAAIAGGLAAAHAKGIVHRDLKPDNIFLTSDGVVKILDFGLARTVGRTSREDNVDTVTLTAATKTGAVVGTPAYMSPEQARGEPADARSDIFSYGCVLYEMIAGQRAFPGDTLAEVSAAILKDEPLDISETSKTLPPELDRVIRHCLEKRPEERFQSARDLAFNLRAIESARPSRSRVLPWAGVTGMLILVLAVILFVFDPGGWRGRPFGEATDERIESLAILPFVNESGDPDAEFLAEGIAESLINNLLTMPELRVIPRNTAFRHKGRELELDQVASELNVRAVLTGRMHKRGNSLIVRAMLEDVQRDTQLWGERYEKDLSDILTIERDITRAISDALRLRLSSRDLARRDKRYTDDPQAHMAYVEGRFWWNKRTAAGFRRALDLFDRAIAIDPEYALAYAGKAGTYSVMGYWTRRPTEVAPLAREAAETAIRLDPTLAEAYPPLGWVHAMSERDWEASERGFRKAIELNPRYATAHHWYSILLVALGRFDEAEREIGRARELDPGSLIINRDYASVALFRRNFDLALQRCQRAVEMDPTFAPTRKILGDIYISLKRYDEAIIEFRKAVELEGRTPRYAGSLGWAYGLAGRRAEALEELRILTELSAQGEYVPAYAFGMVHAGIQNFDLAFEWFDKACDERDNELPFFKFVPRADVLRCDPRFDKLVARLKLPSYPPAPVVDPWPTIKPCLAVLPFEGPSTDTDTLYLKEEIPASIIHGLSNLSGLQVVPRSTAFRYQVRDQDTAAIGRDLGATAVLTGQVNARGDALTIRTELVDVSSKRQLWSERYDRKLADILTIEEDIAERISEKLQLQLTGEDRTQLAKRSTENAQAHQAYLEGRFWWNKRSREGYSKAIELFDEAIRLDPDYALAYAGKADCYCLMVLLDSPPKECIPKAREAAEQALALNDRLAEVHTSLGWIKCVYDWDWTGAERSFKRAIELNPRYVTAYNWYAVFLAAMGRDAEAVEQMTHAHQLDPGSLIINRDLGVVYSWTGQLDRAIEQLRKTIEMDPLFAPAHAHLGRIYTDKGMYDEAIVELETAADLAGGVTHAGYLGQAYAKAGRTDDAMRQLEMLTEFSKQHEVPAFKFSLIHAGLADKERAFELLEKAYENREFPMAILNVAEILGGLRDDPRFDDLLYRIGLEPDPRPSTATPPAGKIMLAVLPFEDMSPEPQEWFSDGLTEEMSAQIGRLRPDKLGVIARTSAMHYKGTTKLAAQIGRELGVDYLVEGSVRLVEKSLRITAKLIQVSDQTQLWSEDFNRTAADVLAIQSDVAQRVAQSLAVELLPRERARLAAKRKVNTAAHSAYLQGRFWWHKQSPEGWSKAIEHFQRAIDIDPQYALAYAGLVDTLCGMASWNAVRSSEVATRAKLAADTACRLDDTLAEVHTSLGWYAMMFEWDWPRAERAFKRAIELNPDCEYGHHLHAHVLTALGRDDEAIARYQRAIQAEPVSPHNRTCFGSHHLAMGRLDDAERQLRLALEWDPEYVPALWYLSSVRQLQGQQDEAVATFELACRIAQNDPSIKSGLASAYAMAGRAEDARRLLDELHAVAKTRHVGATDFARIHAGLGEKDEAFRWLDKAFNEREGWLPWAQFEPGFENLRGDPRFDDLRCRMGIDP